MTFIDRYHSKVGISLSFLDNIAVWKYGQGAKAFMSDAHLWGWAAKVNGKTKEITSADIQAYITQAWGSDYRLVSHGVDGDDYRVTNFNWVNHEVQPVLLIANELFYNKDEIGWALTNFKSVLGYVQGWYHEQVGKTFGLLSPLVANTPYSIREWTDMGLMTKQTSYRGHLALKCKDMVEDLYQLHNDNLRCKFIITIYTGYSPDNDYGAANVGDYSTLPPRACSVLCRRPFDAIQNDTFYMTAHELGHGFGLGHSYDDYPNDRDSSNSIMQKNKSYDAILTNGEKQKLIQSGYFK